MPKRNITLYMLSSQKIIRKDRLLKLLHPIMLKALASQSKFDLTIEGKIPENQQCIFIANHYGYHDAPTAAKIIGKHVYVLVSDIDRNTLGGVAFNLNGVVWINRLDKTDRLRARNEILAHLRAGHDMLMYPEATWNLTPELPMLPMNWGVVKLSRESGVPICPIYVFFTGKECHAKIGEMFFPTGNAIEDISALRDQMATLFWDLLEQEPMEHRADIRPDEHERDIAERYKDYPRTYKDPDAVRRYEETLIYRPKGLVTHEEAFEHLARIRPTMGNAFLFKKGLTG